MIKYEDFLNKKSVEDVPSGFDIPESELNDKMFPFQRAIVKWALKRGRAAIFANTGLGKSLMALEWAYQVCKHTGGNVIILTPLAVAEQFIREGEKFGIQANHAREQSDIKPGINIINYEMLHKIDCRNFQGVCLDESSILKNFDGKYRTTIIDTFSRTPYRLAATATPAPNDYMELGNHSQFLGILSYHEMLSTFFVHDSGETQKWRLKGHAENEFWKWMCGWAVNIRKPSNLGFSDEGYNLPPINYHYDIIETFSEDNSKLTLASARKIRKSTIQEKVEKTLEIVAKYPNEPILIWCGLNEESKMLMSKLSQFGAIEIKGSDKTEKKEWVARWFAGLEPMFNSKFSGDQPNRKILISKPSIFGFGLNFQPCSKQIFCGVDYSFESEYQAIRRSWRFGQTKPVEVHFVLTSGEESIIENVKEKERKFEQMFSNMIEHMKEISKREIFNATKFTAKYNNQLNMELPKFLAA